ncbi:MULTISPECIES: VOC family protein [Agrobacterium tumefaciens complex]|uniref:VOC family protein n=1 Tax=Agrobacterium tumefaciens complex TaxID=1183400 RepID=UPI001FAAA330|nr:VOC family protein [Agrobacterium tumefaciens]UNZ52570.1 VOC family protein [Agrobacterium tumefaciens]
MASTDYFDHNTAPIQIGLVTLKVRNLPLVSTFYQEALGLEVLSTGPGQALLGVDGFALLRLSGDPSLAPHDQRNARLYHVAFALPSSRDLARWLLHAIEKRVPLQGTSDHHTHEAIYLADPEGNGIEIYADRPMAHWQAQDGTILTTSTPLDINDLLAAANLTSWQGLPSGSVIGHVHLRVDQTGKAEHFFGKVLGFEVSLQLQGASFFARGGYHHQVACNNWGGPSFAGHRQKMTGLETFEIIVRHKQELPRIAERAEASGIYVEWNESTLSLRDPWDTTIVLKSKEGADAPQCQVVEG